MSSSRTDPTFRALSAPPPRSARFTAYRAAWDARAATLDPGAGPVHLDIETVAVCDLRCGSTAADPAGFCQVWTHEHIRTAPFEGRRPGYMAPALYTRLLGQAAALGVQSIKLNYRGEPSLHPSIVGFVAQAAAKGFVDIMMNTNGNGGARTRPGLFDELVRAGITDLMFSVDACDPDTYAAQRVNGSWTTLLGSVADAVAARRHGSPDCRIRASAVRTRLNAADIDSGRLEAFWRGLGVDWVSISECYFPAGAKHSWAAATWRPMSPAQYQCPDPFRRMVVTWDGRHTMPCCQGFTLEIDGGPADDIAAAWYSDRFERLRAAHRARTWDTTEPVCRACALTHTSKDI